MKTEAEIITYLRNLQKIKEHSIQKDVAIKILEWVLEESQTIRNLI